jgi:hypothetical protein
VLVLVYVEVMRAYHACINFHVVYPSRHAPRRVHAFWAVVVRQSFVCGDNLAALIAADRVLNIRTVKFHVGGCGRAPCRIIPRGILPRLRHRFGNRQVSHGGSRVNRLQDVADFLVRLRRSILGHIELRRVENLAGNRLCESVAIFRRERSLVLRIRPDWSRRPELLRRSGRRHSHAFSRSRLQRRPKRHYIGLGEAELLWRVAGRERLSDLRGLLHFLGR